jgi:hypothetical protein
VDFMVLDWSSLPIMKILVFIFCVNLHGSAIKKISYNIVENAIILKDDKPSTV